MVHCSPIACARVCKLLRAPHPASLERHHVVAPLRRSHLQACVQHEPTHLQHTAAAAHPARSSFDICTPQHSVASCSYTACTMSDAVLDKAAEYLGQADTATYAAILSLLPPATQVAITQRVARTSQSSKAVVPLQPKAAQDTRLSLTSTGVASEWSICSSMRSHSLLGLVSSLASR